MILLRLFWEFFKTGLMAVGGGLATLPFLYDMSARTGWFSVSELQDMIAVSESTPGPIGVNMATYAGFKTAGIPGSVVATLGLMCPSVIIILIICGVLKRFKESRIVAGIFSGLRPASVALIASVLLTLCISNFIGDTGLFGFLNWKALLLAVLVFFALQKYKKVHPALFLALGAVYGILLKL